MKTHFSFKHLLFIGGAVLYSMQISAVKNPVDYVSTLVGTQSKFELSNGHTWGTVGHIPTMPTKSGASNKHINPARG